LAVGGLFFAAGSHPDEPMANGLRTLAKTKKNVKGNGRESVASDFRKVVKPVGQSCAERFLIVVQAFAR